MALLPNDGIELTLFKELIDCESNSEINRLRSRSWIIMDEETHRINLHPLIAEVVLDMDDTKPSFEACNLFLKRILDKFGDSDSDDEHIKFIIREIFYHISQVTERIYCLVKSKTVTKIIGHNKNKKDKIMPEEKYKVMLTADERERLKNLTHKGSGESARTIMHANILLLTNEGTEEKQKNVREIAQIFDISPTTVNQVRKMYTESGIEGALNRKSRVSPPVAAKITGDFEAK
jgi:hypothetical protein